MDDILNLTNATVLIAALGAIVFIINFKAGSKNKTTVMDPRDSIENWISLDPGSSSISIENALKHIERIQEFIDENRSTLEKHINAEKQKEYESFSPAEILSLASKEEIKSLQEIVQDNSTNPTDLILALRREGTNSVKNFWSSLKGIPEGHAYTPYSELIRTASKRVGVDISKSQTLYQSEVCLLGASFHRMLDKMPNDERRKFLSELSRKQKEESYGKELAIGGGMAAAQLSGFGIYLASSTLVGATTSLLGITLPFAAYTGMSSAISVIIGPAGWITLGGWLLYKAGKPDVNRVSTGLLLIAHIRQRLIRDRDITIIQLSSDLELVNRELQATIKSKSSAITQHINKPGYSTEDIKINIKFITEITPPNFSSTIARIRLLPFPDIARSQMKGDTENSI